MLGGFIEIEGANLNDKLGNEGGEYGTAPRQFEQNRDDKCGILKSAPSSLKLSAGSVLIDCPRPCSHTW